MTESTKRWLTCDLSPEDKSLALQQVTDAESQEKTQYQITVSNGWFDIEYGNIKGSGKTG